MGTPTYSPSEITLRNVRGRLSTLLNAWDQMTHSERTSEIDRVIDVLVDEHEAMLSVDAAPSDEEVAEFWTEVGAQMQADAQRVCCRTNRR